MGRTKPSIAILGAGAGGMAAAHMLLEQGNDDFVIYERSDGVGGVWRQNTYPGAACDVKSHFYSFSFERNPDWSEAYSGQPEILDYFERVADRHGLRPHLRPHVTIDRLEWNEKQGSWTIHSREGDRFEHHIVICALGLFNEPKYPDIPGLNTFDGTAFHSSMWNHTHDLTGERVAVIGTGPSAVQFVPRIAPKTAHTYVFQRQPGWVLPKPDATYTKREKRVFRRVPLAARIHRAKIWWSMERFAQIYPGGKIHAARENVARTFIENSVEDPELRRKLIPSYPVGCSRMLPSNDWLPTLQRPNVDLVTDHLKEVRPHSIVTEDGVEREIDTLIFATGFTSSRYLSALTVEGRGSRRLHDEWHEGVRAHLGMAVPGFPNFFLLYGPNTNGTTSVIHVLECQVRYIGRVLKRMERRRQPAVDVRRSAYESYDRKIQAALEGSVWLGGCGSYFLDAQGKVRTQLPYRFYRYWIMSAVVKPWLYRWGLTGAGREGFAPLRTHDTPDTQPREVQSPTWSGVGESL